MILRRWNPAFYYDHPEVFNINIYGIQIIENTDFGRNNIYGIKYGRHIHNQHGKHAVQVRHIPEENVAGRNDQSYAYIEANHAKNRENQQNKFPGKRHIIEKNKNEENAEGQAKVNKRRNIL